MPAFRRWAKKWKFVCTICLVKWQARKEQFQLWLAISVIAVCILRFSWWFYFSNGVFLLQKYPNRWNWLLSNYSNNTLKLKHLNLNSRTLHRKLFEEQTNFKDILQETRFGIAKQLLIKNFLTISEISYMLSYSDLGNFSRSLKIYTGKSPQEYRNEIIT